MNLYLCVFVCVSCSYELPFSQRWDVLGMMPCKWKITLGREGLLMGLVGCLESDNHNTFKMEPSVSTILFENKKNKLIPHKSC